VIVAWTMFIVCFALSILFIIAGVLGELGKIEGRHSVEGWLLAVTWVLITSVAAQYIWG